MRKPKAPPGTYWRNNVLWGQAKIKGQLYRWTLHTDDPKIAKKQYKEDRQRLLDRSYQRHPSLMFAEVLAAWEPYIKQQVGEATLIRYACSLAQLQPFLEGKRLDEIDGALVGEIITERQLDEVTNATIKRDLVALSSVMNFAVLKEGLASNPVLPTMRLLKERRQSIVLPTDEQILRMIARAPGNFAKLIDAGWRTGCRLSELVTAKRPQLDHARRQLMLTGKGNKVRVIDLAPFDGYEVFRSLPPMIGKAWLFWHDNGQPYRNASSRFRAMSLDVASTDEDFQPFRFHDLRHRHAVDWLKSGRSIYDLQQRLGHGSIKTTEIYLGYLTPNERRVAKQEVGQ